MDILNVLLLRTVRNHCPMFFIFSFRVCPGDVKLSRVYCSLFAFVILFLLCFSGKLNLTEPRRNTASLPRVLATFLCHCGIEILNGRTLHYESLRLTYSFYSGYLTGSVHIP